MSTIPIVLLVVAAIMLIVAAVQWIGTDAFLRRAVRTNGRILRIERRVDSDGDTFYHPVFTYETTEGERVKTSPLGTSWSPFRINQTVKVLYDPAQLDSARIQSWFQIWGGAVLWAAIGIFVGIGGLLWSHLTHN